MRGLQPQRDGRVRWSAWLGRLFLSEHIPGLIVEECIHRHQFCANLFVGVPRRKRPTNESAVSHVTNLNFIVMQKTRGNLAHKAVHRTHPVLAAPTATQLTNQVSHWNWACAQPSINSVRHVALLRHSSSRLRNPS